MLKNNLDTLIGIVIMPLCAHISKSSILGISDYKNVWQQESTSSYRKIACGMIMISEIVILLSVNGP